MVDITGYTGTKRFRVGSDLFFRYTDEDYTGHPAFSMDLVLGIPVVDLNIALTAITKLKGLLSPKTVTQLSENLTIAAAHKWCTSDLQYFILTQDQTLHGRTYSRGDLVLFDFGDWQQVDSSINFSTPLANLQRLVDIVEATQLK